MGAPSGHDRRDERLGSRRFSGTDGRHFLRRRTSPGSAVFHYLGPSFAVLLFARVDVPGVAWLRIASAALRVRGLAPPVARRSGHSIATAACSSRALGAVFASMNVCFYVAMDRLPLATVAAVEFIGPIALALFGARVSRNVARRCGRSAGCLPADSGAVHRRRDRVAFASRRCVVHRVHRPGAPRGTPGARRRRPRRGDAVRVRRRLPIGLSGAAHALADPVALAAGAGVGISSSVIPYVLDQLAMARLPRATYALFVALLPATATVIGALVLRQLPTATDVAGIGLVMLGVALHRPQG